MTNLLAAVAPLLVGGVLLGGTRLPPWVAGLGALAAALPSLLSHGPTGTSLVAFVAEESLRGVWLAWQAVSVMLAGLFFHAATRRAGATRSASRVATAPIDGHSLFTLVLFVGPFVESAVGFGVGIVVVVGRLVAAGVAPLPAALLSLLSQTLVPWGAFGVGTLIGAEVGGIDFDRLAFASALLSVPLLLAWLPFYWRVSGALLADAVRRPSRAGECGWTLAAALALVLANRHADPQVSVILAIGATIVSRRLLHPPPEAPPLARVARDVWPYLALCAVLLATRLIAPLDDWLREAASVRPYADMPPFSPLHHPSLWLALIGAFALRAGGGPVRAALRETLATGWRPVLVTVLFVVLARWMIASDSARIIAEAVAASLGRHAVLASPTLAGIAGFLTGSNAASNAMMMPIQSALVGSVGVSALLVSALQNVGGSAMTALSPARIVLAASLAGGIGERTLYRHVALFAVPPLLVLTIVAALALAFAR